MRIVFSIERWLSSLNSFQMALECNFIESKGKRKLIHHIVQLSRYYLERTNTLLSTRLRLEESYVFGVNVYFFNSGTGYKKIKVNFKYPY